jgi:hypothetical protein
MVGVFGVAIYSLRVQTIGRAEGRSVIAAAAYRSGTSLADERLAMDFDFTKKRPGVAHAVVMAPENAPAEYLDRERLWNAAEKADSRKDSVPAREILIALPHELSADARRQLVETFVWESLVKRGMIADVAIHLPGKDGDDRNHHAHILVTTRDVGPDGFGKKNPDWHAREFVIDVRREWAQVQNKYLELCAPEAAKVSEKSLDAQGIERLPTEHLGPHATAMERRGERTDLGENNRDIEAENKGLEAQDRRLDKAVGDAFRAGRWVRRPTDSVIKEMDDVRAQIAGQRDAWVKERDAIQAPKPVSVRALEAALTREESAAYSQAKQREEAAKVRARANGISAKRIAAWINNPAGAALKSLFEWNEHLDRAAKARRETERARRALEEKRTWVKSEPGRAHIDNLRRPQVEVAAEAKTQRRTLERKILRADKRLKEADKDILHVKVAKRLGLEEMRTPPEVPTAPGRGVANTRRYFRFSSAEARATTEKAPELDVRDALKFIRALAPGAPIPARPAKMPDLPPLSNGPRSRERDIPDLPDF